MDDSRRVRRAARWVWVWSLGRGSVVCAWVRVYLCGGLRKVINFKYFNFVRNNKQADKQQQQQQHE